MSTECLLTREALEALHLSDGAEVEVRGVGVVGSDSAHVRTITTEEALASYRKTLPQLRDA